MVLNLPVALSALCLVVSAVRAEITVLGQVPLAQATLSGSLVTVATTTTLAADPATTTLAAYNDTLLDPPAIPDPAPSTQFTLDIAGSSANVVGLSIVHQDGAFWGFSIEMSVLTQILGRNSTHLNVPFLNLMSNIIERSGKLGIRCGGNTQERAELVDVIEDGNGRSLGKEQIDSSATTKTPAVTYVVDWFYMLSNITSLLPELGWYLGIPFNQTDPFRLQIAELAENIMGDGLLGLQAGNEPDFYLGNGLRVDSYTPQDYSNEVGLLIEALDANSNILTKNNLIGPSISGTVATSDKWTAEMVFDTGFLDQHGDRLNMISVEHYPDNNCAAQFGGDNTQKIPQLIFQDYLNHTSGQILASAYQSAANTAVALGKPMVMFETNTASCGGFPGISDSFGASLWALDYGLQMAYYNFTHGLLHVGGQNNYYNPFTAPPTNQSTFNEWTVGAIYYSALVAAEVLQDGNQIMDLNGNDGSMFTPQYGVWKDGQLDKVALFNYMTDPTGGMAYTATVHLTDGTVPNEVYVKYLLSDSVSTKDNITWAGQTFGPKFSVDGRLKNDINIVTVGCDTGANTCAIRVPAPGFALVFFNSAARDEASPTEVQTFATTAVTKTQNTVTIDAAALATSNGHSGKDRERIGSTSRQSTGGASVAVISAMAVALGALAVVLPFLR